MNLQVHPRKNALSLDSFKALSQLASAYKLEAVGP